MILVIDDEPMVLTVQSLALKGSGYAVLAARNRREAIDLFEAHGRDIELVVLDVSLGSDSGFEIASELKRVQPGLRTLFISGYSRADIAPQDGLGEERIHLLEKPFMPADLVRAVKEQLATPAQKPAHS